MVPRRDERREPARPAPQFHDVSARAQLARAALVQVEGDVERHVRVEASHEVALDDVLELVVELLLPGRGPRARHPGEDRREPRRTHLLAQLLQDLIGRGTDLVTDAPQMVRELLLDLVHLDVPWSPPPGRAPRQ
jgi:hypothetical protein